jgi:hypothetical protein
MPYEWLPTTFTVLIARGIEPYEVLQVLYGVRRCPVPVHDSHGLMLLNVWGRTKAGRPLVVTVRPAGGFDAEIVGARDMADDERKEFESWESSQ